MASSSNHESNKIIIKASDMDDEMLVKLLKIQEKSLRLNHLSHSSKQI